MMKLQLSRFMNVSSGVILLLFYLNFASVCTLTISCASYIPTFSYLGTFRTHDTVTVLGLTFFAFLMIPIFISWHIKTQGILSLEDSLFMIFLEFSIFLLTIMDGLIDEVNGVDFNPIDNMHQFLSFTLCLISII